MSNNNYLEVVYNSKRTPFTSYPMHLSAYIVHEAGIQKGQKLLDLGCGRGEFLKGFIACGVDGYGIDQGDYASLICPEAKLKTGDLESPLPYEDNFFDVVYSKSVLEHFYHPEKLVKEIFRILKPGGIVITMTPDWEVIYKMFYEDYTHRTPFTRTSLKDIFAIHGFEHVSCTKFLQLPVLWKYPFLLPVSLFVRACCPDFLKSKSKFIRFSKEGMLYCRAAKPLLKEM